MSPSPDVSSDLRELPEENITKRIEKNSQPPMIQIQNVDSTLSHSFGFRWSTSQQLFAELSSSGNGECETSAGSRWNLWMQNKSGDTCSSDRRDTVDTASLLGTGGWGSQEGPGKSHGNSRHSNSTSTNCRRHRRWSRADMVASLQTGGFRKVSLQCSPSSHRGAHPGCVPVRECFLHSVCLSVQSCCAPAAAAHGKW